MINNFLKLCIIFLSYNVLAQEIEINKDKLIEISQNPTWLKLLHFNNGKSQVITKDFFLSKKGNLEPLSELKATIKAYYKPFNKNSIHARCLFPARYYWLSQFVNFKNYSKLHPNCYNYKAIKKLLNKAKSISVIFVSGFLGNPASAFGHSFIKINRLNQNNSDLFDNSISYGANLPENYNVLSYILNGIFGGYTASYSDSYFYDQDIIYTNQESREMWEYELIANKYQINLFVLHVTEIINQKFTYYFFNKNCGYMISNLLELIYPINLTKNHKLWYAPVETFYNLENFEKKTNTKIIKQVKYIPSDQQKLYFTYIKLPVKLKKVIKTMINQEITLFPKEDPLTKQQKAQVLDFILIYRKYKFAYKTFNQDKTNELQKFNRKLLLARLQLPISTNKELYLTKKPITTWDKPINIGLGYVNKYNINYNYINFSPFNLDGNGYNNLNGDEFTVLQGEIFYNQQANKIFIDSFYIAKIKKLKTNKLPFKEENNISWNISSGFKSNSLIEHFFYIEGGLGYATNIGKIFKAYAFSNIAYNKHLFFSPTAGIFFNFNKLRITTELIKNYDLQTKEIANIINIRAKQKLSKNLSLSFKYYNGSDYNNYNNNLIQLGINLFL